MTFYEEYKTGHLLIPAALLENFTDLFDNAEDYLVWQFFLLEKDIAPSDVAKKIGKGLADINQILQRLQDSAVLKIDLVDLPGKMDMVFDVSPAFEKLDHLLAAKAGKSESVVPSKNQLQTISKAFEAEMGMITPMQLEELRAWLDVDQYEPALILAALREASINRKVSLNYVRAILRRWRMDGITSLKEVEFNREEREMNLQAKTANSVAPSQMTIPIDGPWSQPK